MTDKKITHEDIIEKWVRHWIDTRNDDNELKVGDESGEAPFGVKIMFDGYGENDDGSENRYMWSFAVFVHKDSVTKAFKPHDSNALAIIHRPKEECFITVWWQSEQDEIDIVTSIEHDNCTQLDRKFVIDLIHKIDNRDSKQ